MSLLSTNEHSRQHSSPVPQSASTQEMGEAGQKVAALFKQINDVRESFFYVFNEIKTLDVYNYRMKGLDTRRRNIMQSLKDMGIDNLDTRPLERHLQVRVNALLLYPL